MCYRHHFESHIDRRYPRDNNDRRPGPELDLRFEIGPDLISQVVHLFGLPNHVQASLAMQREGAHTNDWMHVVLEYGDVLRVILHGGVLAANGFNRFVVHGEKGTCIVKKRNAQEYFLRSKLLREYSEDFSPSGVKYFDGKKHAHASSSHPLPNLPCVWRDFYVALVDALQGSGVNPGPPSEALAVMAVLDAIEESARTGQSATLMLIQKEYEHWSV